MGLSRKLFQLCPPPARVLEVGFGSGVLCGFLQDYNYQVVGIDKDPAVVQYARKRLEEEMLGKPILLECDAFHLAEGLKEYAPFDSSVGQGVLEHFEDAEIVELLRQQLLVANLCLFSVPSELYPRREYGNERLLPLSHWFELCLSLGDGIEPTLNYYGRDEHILGVLKKKGAQS